MTTNAYSELDAEILKAISSGRVRFFSISAAVMEFARALVENDDDTAWRFVDRRLQALRKAGKIAYNAKTGWSLVKQGGGGVS